MVLQGYLGDMPLDLPEGFTIPVELHSPIYDYNEMRVGDFVLDIAFPFTPRNKVAFGFAHRPDVGDKNRRYPGFRLERDGSVELSGVLVLRDADMRLDAGEYRCDFYTNIFPPEILEKPLHEVMTKKVVLGEDTDEIVDAITAINNAVMSTNGITGAVMKFPPHRNTDLYGASNPYWHHSGEEWDPAREDYELGDVVTTRVSDRRFLDAYWMKTGIGANQDPNDPAQTTWSRISNGIVNHWDSQWNRISANRPAVDGGTRVLGGARYAVTPFLQLHDVLRETALALGYTVEGEYMDDMRENRALLYSNYALDRRSSWRAAAAVDEYAVNDEPEELADLLVPIEVEDPEDENDPRGIINSATHKIERDAVGAFTLRVRFTFTPELTTAIGQDHHIIVGLYDGDTELVYEEVASTDTWYFTSQAGPPAYIEQVKYGQWPLTERTVEVTFSGVLPGINLWLFVALGGTSTLLQDRYAGFGPGTVSDLDLQYVDDMREYLNRYSGVVRYRDHVPDTTVGGFLGAVFKQWVLWPTWNTRTRVLRLDYVSSVLQRGERLPLPPPIRESRRTEIPPKRRFVFGYDSTGDEDPPDMSGYEMLEPVNTAQELPPTPSFPPSADFAGKAILVRNENRYYFTEAESGDVGVMRWKAGGHAYTDLKWNEDGELEEVSLPIAPLPMRKAVDIYGREHLVSELNGAGRSAAFHTEGGRHDMAFTYWRHIEQYDEHTLVLATPAGYGNAGDGPYQNALLDSAMHRWRRLLEMMAAEERHTATFVLDAETRKRLAFDLVCLYMGAPVLPIRIAEDVGRPGAVEIEMRRMNRTELVAVTDDDDEAGAYEGLYTIPELDALIYAGGYIPVATPDEFDAIRTESTQVMGAGTPWQNLYPTGPSKKYVQVRPLDFAEWGTWGDYIDGFSGVYDGNLLPMTNITATEALFDLVNFEALRHMRVSGTATNATGLLAGIVRSVSINADAEIRDCRYAGDVTMTGTGLTNMRCGGILAWVNTIGAGATLTLHDCEYEGTLSSASGNFVGGVVGRAYNFGGAGRVLLEGCATRGRLESEAGFFGGIIGAATNTTVRNCVNHAELEGGTTFSNPPGVGGIVGTAGDEVVIETSANRGPVTGVGIAIAGGIVGATQNAVVAIADCENYASIVNSNNSSDRGTGGLMGRGAAVIARCRNRGDVTAANYTGGLVGYGQGVDIEESANVGKVSNTGVLAAGGLLGYGQSGTVSIKNAYSLGIVEAGGASGSYAGGIIGRNGVGLVILNSFAACEVTGNTVGGVMGLATGPTPTVTATYWDTNLGPATTAGDYGSPRSTAQLKLAIFHSLSFSAWDTPPWDFGTNEDYPDLSTLP